ncbi:MAG: hypothetical protein WCP92_07720 [bacterium]
MKTIMKMLYVSIMVCGMCSFSGCAKDEINPSLTPFGQKAGDEIVSHENYVDSHRGNLSYPEACDVIANLGVVELDGVLFNEMPEELNTFVKVTTNIYRNPKDYKKWWDSKFGRSDLIKELGDDAIVDEDVRRVLPYLAKGIKNKVIPYVVDGICYGGGVRNQWTDDGIQTTFRDTIPSDFNPEYWIVTYQNEAYYYYYYYAVDPGNYAEAKKMGAHVPTVTELQQMFPYEEIRKQTDLNVYRKETLKQYNFTKADWKPAVAVVVTK